ncbi:MAG: DUF2293 domain-containing protein [Hyphomicrobiales bacterium]|nr:DUF2293 domain-containing protein [Hyphomicrobiales bacterium]OQW84856.1 MAG: hypothetical protein BVN31_02010 [Proteobacteria bacterium ST_bin15]
MRGTKRQDAILKAMRLLIPRAPLADFAPILEAATSARMKTLPPQIAAWLSIIAYIRHVHSDYDALLADGYERDAARFFVREAIDEILTGWGCQRRLEEHDDEATDMSEPVTPRPL